MTTRSRLALSTTLGTSRSAQTSRTCKLCKHPGALPSSKTLRKSCTFVLRGKKKTGPLVSEIYMTLFLRNSRYFAWPFSYMADGRRPFLFLYQTMLCPRSALQLLIMKRPVPLVDVLSPFFFRLPCFPHTSFSYIQPMLTNLPSHLFVIIFSSEQVCCQPGRRFGFRVHYHQWTGHYLRG